MNELVAGLAYFAFVFFKAFQQRNVAFMHYKWVLPISYCMAVTEVIVISVIAMTAVDADTVWEMIPTIIAVGTGGGCGAVVSMWVHKKIVKTGD